MSTKISKGALPIKYTPPIITHTLEGPYLIFTITSSNNKKQKYMYHDIDRKLYLLCNGVNYVCIKSNVPYDHQIIKKIIYAAFEKQGY